MTVDVTRVRRNSRLALIEGRNAKGHEVLFVWAWSRFKFLAEDLALGEAVSVEVPEAAILSVKNPRMRRYA